MAKKEVDKVLPNIVYVYEELPDGDDPFLCAARTIIDTASTDGPRIVGVYYLSRVETVQLRVKRSRVK